MGKGQAWSTIIILGALLFGFTIATILKTPLEFSETENRVLAQRPQINAAAILNGEFEADYEEYLTDQFVLRDDWIGLKTNLERLLLKKESKDIYFAEDGYLIEKHTGAFNSDMAARNITALAQFIRQIQQPFGAEHITVMIVPNAVEILADKLPPFAPPSGETDYLNQLAQSLPEGVWFDTEGILKEHDQEPLYYQTDHHWKTLAAFYTYQQWAAAQGYRVPELSDYNIETVTDSFEGTIQSKLGIKTAGDTIELFLPLKEVIYTVHREDGKMPENSLYDDSALDTKDKYAVYFGGNQGLLQINTKAEGNRSILIIKDSYANCFIPFMLEEFKQIDILDLRYDRQRLSNRIAEGEYTDILFLYNAAGLAEDTNIGKLIS